MVDYGLNSHTLKEKQLVIVNSIMSLVNCFMTDIDGTPVFVGNPVLNEKLYDVFMEIVDKYSILSREI